MANDTPELTVQVRPRSWVHWVFNGMLLIAIATLLLIFGISLHVYELRSGRHAESTGPWRTGGLLVVVFLLGMAIIPFWRLRRRPRSEVTVTLRGTTLTCWAKGDERSKPINVDLSGCWKVCVEADEGHRDLVFHFNDGTSRRLFSEELFDPEDLAQVVTRLQFINHNWEATQVIESKAGWQIRSKAAEESKPAK